MPTPDETIHDLIDRLEELGVTVSERLRQELAQMDLARLIDVDDEDFDREFALTIMDIVDAEIVDEPADGDAEAGA